MNRLKICAAFVACLFAAPTFAQFRLDWSIVARSGSVETGLNDVSGPVQMQSGSTIRLEIRYRLHDLVADDRASRGLAASAFSFVSDRGNEAGSIQRARLTLAQSDPGAFGLTGNVAPLNPDATGDGGGATGLVEPFRGSLTVQAGNDTLSNGAELRPNGTLGASGISLGQRNYVLPLVLAAPQHQSWSGPASKSITSADTNTNLTSWTVYCFEYTAAPGFVGDITFRTLAFPDPQTGTNFAYFVRRGVANLPIVTNGQSVREGTLTISVVPAPSVEMALAAASPLLGWRRRRR